MNKLIGPRKVYLSGKARRALPRSGMAVRHAASSRIATARISSITRKAYPAS